MLEGPARTSRLFESNNVSPVDLLEALRNLIYRLMGYIFPTEVQAKMSFTDNVESLTWYNVGSKMTYTDESARTLVDKTVLASLAGYLNVSLLLLLCQFVST